MSRRRTAGLPLRTRLACAAFDRISNRRPLRELTPAQIQASRGVEPPHWPPFDRIFGAVPREVRMRDDVAETRAGECHVRFYESTTHVRPGPLVVYFHGGGWVRGSIGGYDAVCGQVAARTGALVLSVGYRLAPEHPFPAAVEDAYDVTCWAVSRAEVLGVDAARVAVMGDSAGGNLAAVVAQVARAEGTPQLAAQVLVYPGTDATLASPSITENAAGPVLTREAIVDFLDLYHPFGDRRDPRLSPLFADDLSGLPRTLIQSAQYDPLRDDGRRYAQALRRAGVQVRYTEYADVPHGYLSMPGVVASRYQPISEIAAELREAFA
jgi:acetyl esterase